MIADKIDSIIELALGVGDALGSVFLDTPPNKLIDLIGVEDQDTLLVKGFGFVSVIKIDGFYGSVGEKEFLEARQSTYDGLKNRMKDDSNHLVKFYYESDPDAAKEVLESNFLSIRSHLKQCRLDLDDLIDEKIEANLPYTQEESAFIAFYTYPSSQNEIEVEQIDNVGTGNSIQNFTADKLLMNHKSIIGSLLGILGAKLNVRLVNSEAILAEIFRCINGNGAHRTIKFQIAEDENPVTILNKLAHLPSRVIPLESNQVVKYAREITKDNNKSAEPLLPPPLGDQLIASGCYDTGTGTIISGSRMYAPIAVNVYGRDIRDIGFLVRGMKGIPFRLAMTIKANGLNKSFLEGFETFAASIGGLLNKRMKLRNRTLGALESMRLSSEIVSLSITGCTWAPLDKRIDTDTGKHYYSTYLLDKRLSRFKTAINDWSSMQAKDCVGDGLECLFSTFPGLIGYHVAQQCPAPLSDLTNILPINRPSSEWDSGSLAYRTEDGKIIFSAPMSDKQSSEVIVLTGDMGSGKSAALAAMNLGFIMQPSANGDLPYLRGIDFGYSQKGICDAIRDGLLDSEKHRVGYMQLTKDNKINVHDLILGNRFPLHAHRNFLISTLMAATDSISDFAHHSGLCAAAIDLAYKMFNDDEGNPQAKRYKRGDSVVDDFIEKHQINVTENVTTWYNVADKIFLHNEPRIAARAQRYAVPTFTDYFRIATEQELTQEYPHLHNGVPVCQSFSVALNETLKNIPMLAEASDMDISDSPIFIVDLKDILPSGEQPRQVQATNSIIYLAVMRLLTADFFIDDKVIPELNPMYVKYHSDRIKKIMSASKRFFVDEKHRINSIPSASSGVDAITFEGRKFGISVVQCSQLLSHISEAVAKLATTVFICGSSSRDEINSVKANYDFSDFHADLIMSLKKPSKEGAHFFVRYMTKARKICLKLINTEGPRHLCMIATNKEDRAVRDGLAQIARSSKIARGIYAAEFPSGSVKSEIERRIQARSEGIYESPLPGNDYIKDIIYDLSRKYNLLLDN